jgi:hypothetical protein
VRTLTRGCHGVSNQVRGNIDDQVDEAGRQRPAPGFAGAILPPADTDEQGDPPVSCVMVFLVTMDWRCWWRD